MESIEKYKVKETEKHLYHVGVNRFVHEQHKGTVKNNWRVVLYNETDFNNLFVLKNGANAYYAGLANYNPKFNDIFENPDNSNRIKLVHSPKLDADQFTDEEVEQLRSEYETLFGKKPGGNMKPETVKQKIEEFKQGNES